MNNFIKIRDSEYLDLNKVTSLYVYGESDENCRVMFYTEDGRSHDVALNARAFRQWLKSAVRFDFTEKI